MTRPLKLRAPEPSEAAIHEAVAEYLDRALPADCFWSSIEHQVRIDRRAQDAVRTIVKDGASRKRRGVKPGIPDILLCYGRVLMCIELKTRVGALSPAQIERRTELLRSGAYWALCRSVEDVEAALRAWDVPLRASVGARVRESAA